MRPSQAIPLHPLLPLHNPRDRAACDWLDIDGCCLCPPSRSKRGALCPVSVCSAAHTGCCLYNLLGSYTDEPGGGGGQASDPQCCFSNTLKKETVIVMPRGGDFPQHSCHWTPPGHKARLAPLIQPRAGHAPLRPWLAASSPPCPEQWHCSPWSGYKKQGCRQGAAHHCVTTPQHRATGSYCN